MREYNLVIVKLYNLSRIFGYYELVIYYYESKTNYDLLLYLYIDNVAKFHDKLRGKI
jgi:hypothetical protein